MRTYKFSLHSFSEIDNLPFSKDDYSKFKHGSKKVSRTFGKHLGESFLKSDIYQKIFSAIEHKDVVVCSAPYKYIPVASAILKDYFVSVFNGICSIKRNPTIDLKIFRSHSYNDDYGNLTQEEREKAINSDDFHIDKIFIENKTLILIDDIRITGSHEKRMIDLLKKNDFKGDVFFLYFAQLDNVNEIHPNIENELNYSFVKNLDDINYIINNEEFIYNTRVVKYILNSNEEDFKQFIKIQTPIFRNSLLTYLQGNNYHKITEYKRNFNHLISILDS